MPTGALTPACIVDGAYPVASTNLTSGITIPYVGAWPTSANKVEDTLSAPRPAGGAAAGASPSSGPRVGAIAHSFERDWYNRVHVIPAKIDLGNLLQDQVRTIDVWNAHFVARTLNSILQTGTDGLTLTRPVGAPSEPAAYGALILLTYSLSISQQGPPVIDAKYTFNFSTPETPLLLVSGSRVVAFPFSCQTPVLEQLEWATDIHESYDGHEKRVQARELPRQSFEMTYLSGSRQEVANIRNSIIGNMGLVFGVPMWQETRPLLATAGIGATTITVTTIDADFRGGVGELAILWRSFTDYEVVEVQTVNVGSLALARPTAKAHAAGSTVVVPVRLCFMEDAPGDGASQHGPAEFRIRWKGTQVADLSESDGNLTLYLGSPVIQDTNHVEGLLGEQFSGKLFDIDSGSGTLIQVARRDVPEVSTQKTWVFEDVAKSFKLRKLLYALRGRQRSFWLPTFRHDFILAAQIGSSVTQFEALPVEYGRFVSEQPPFNHIAIYLNNGTVFFRQVTGHGTSGSNETISINTALGQVVNPSDVKFICFLVRSRLASDRVEMVHHRLGATTVSVPVVGVIQ